MRTLQAVDEDIQQLIKAVAKLADERDQISPNPLKIVIKDTPESDSLAQLAQLAL